MSQRTQNETVKWNGYSRRSWMVFLGFGFLLLVITLKVGSLLLGSWSITQLPPASVLARAGAGVSRNGDWQPVTRRLDGLDMVMVPAGCFSMGSTALQLTEAVDSCERFFGRGKCQIDFMQSETPPREVCFDHPFWIGETEVTNRQYGSSSTTDNKAAYRGPSWPRETVTWGEAAQFCKDHNARLPTEAEWEFSARGPDSLIYPWGDEFDPERLVSGRQTPANVASVPAGASWVGAFDLSGNVAEWVAEVYAPYSLASTTGADLPAHGEQRVFRGGSWFSFAAFFVRASHRESVNPDTVNSTIGFRCARNLD